MHKHYFDRHFPSEPGLAVCPLIIKAIVAGFFTDGMPYLSHNQQYQSTEGLMEISFNRLQHAQPPAQPTGSMH